MSKDLTIAIQIDQPDLAKQCSGLIKKLKGVNAVDWPGDLAEKGPLAVKAVPNIILIEDRPASGDLFVRVQTIKGHFPQAALIIVSKNKDPQHIIAAMKAGASEYLVDPVEEQTLINAVDEVKARLATTADCTKTFLNAVSIYHLKAACLPPPTIAAHMPLSSCHNRDLLSSSHKSWHGLGSWLN